MEYAYNVMNLVLIVKVLMIISAFNAFRIIYIKKEVLNVYCFVMMMNILHLIMNVLFAILRARSVMGILLLIAFHALKGSFLILT